MNLNRPVRATEGGFPAVAVTGGRERRAVPATPKLVGWSTIGVLLFVAAVATQAATGGIAPVAVKEQELPGEGRHEHLLNDPPRDTHSADSDRLHTPQVAPQPGKDSQGAQQRVTEPFPYTYLGAVGEEGNQRKVVLVRNSELHVVGVGAILAGAYEITAIHRDGVDVFFLLTRTRQFISYSEMAPPQDNQFNSVTGISSSTAGSDVPGMSYSAQRSKATAMEKGMDIRPPGDGMETRAPSPDDEMVTLPPSGVSIQSFRRGRP